MTEENCVKSSLSANFNTEDQVVSYRETVAGSPKPVVSLSEKPVRQKSAYLVVDPGPAELISNNVIEIYGVKTVTELNFSRKTLEKSGEFAQGSHWKMGTHCRITTSRERTCCTWYYASRMICRSSR